VCGGCFLQCMYWRIILADSVVHTSQILRWDLSGCQHWFQLKKKFFQPHRVILFPSSHYNYNCTLQFFCLWCWWQSSSSPEWVGITYAAQCSILICFSFANCCSCCTYLRPCTATISPYTSRNLCEYWIFFNPCFLQLKDKNIQNVNWNAVMFDCRLPKMPPVKMSAFTLPYICGQVS
jgi:hypothetical protein